MHDQSSLDIDRADAAFIESVFPPGATVDERFPATAGVRPYVFPNDGERGLAFAVNIKSVNSLQWGITYVPETDVTIRDTDGLVVTFNIPRTFSGITARFDNLKAQLYEDETWTTGNARLHLVNTRTLPWSPIAAGDNRLIITNSELADQFGSTDRATVSITDSTASFVRGFGSVRIDLERAFVNGDVIAGDTSTLSLIDTVVAGRVIRERNATLTATRVHGLGRGFELGHGTRLTAARDDVISGIASIKGTSSGAHQFNPSIYSDPQLIRLQRDRTYRVSFRYRILTPASERFNAFFISDTAADAGNFLTGLSINGRAGDAGTAEFSTTLGPYDDYRVSLTIVGAGAWIVDDLLVIDTATGQVVASENADTPVVVETPGS